MLYNGLTKNPWVHTDINKQTGEKEKFTSSAGKNLINMEGMMRLENHHLTTITTDSHKNHEWMPKLVGASWWVTEHSNHFKEFPTRCIMFMKGNIATV